MRLIRIKRIDLKRLSTARSNVRFIPPQLPRTSHTRTIWTFSQTILPQPLTTHPSSHFPQHHHPLSTTTTSHQTTKTIPFFLADIGEGIAEVELLQWYVSEGDTLSQFDRVCEVQSDKATVEITSRFDGIVERLDGAPGDMISVGCPLLHIRVVDEGGTGEKTTTEDASTSSSSTLHNVDDEEDKLHIPSVPAKSSEFSSGFGFGERQGVSKCTASPAVRKIAKDHKIDLGTVVGTGPKGRVLKADLLQLIQPTTTTTKVSAPAPKAQSPLQQPQPSSEAPSEEPQIIPIRGYNRLMIKTMTSSLQIPHLTFSDELDITRLLAIRQTLKTSLAASSTTTTTDDDPQQPHPNVKLTLLPFAIKATSLALTQFPHLNASLDLTNTSLILHPDHNIGIAMDTPRGLAVPVIRQCQHRSILDIARELTRLQHAASQNTLTEHDITGATFSLSNIGSIGGTYMSPIVTVPQIAIGAMGTIRRVPRFVSSTSLEIKEVHVLNMSWGADHRAVDGATIAKFGNLWKVYMEDPVMMLLDLK